MVGATLATRHDKHVDHHDQRHNQHVRAAHGHAERTSEWPAYVQVQQRTPQQQQQLVHHPEENVRLGPGEKRHELALAAIPKAELKKAAYWLNSLGQDWRGDVPMKLHSGGTTTEGTIAFSEGFNRYVGYLGDPSNCSIPGCQECAAERKRRASADERPRTPESRMRSTRAFRKLRKVAPREFDACYMYCINGYSVQYIARLMTERAIRLGKPERYHPVSVLLLLLSGIDKVVAYW